MWQAHEATSPLFASGLKDNSEFSTLKQVLSGLPWGKRKDLPSSLFVFQFSDDAYLQIETSSVITNFSTALSFPNFIYPRLKHDNATAGTK